MLSAFEPQPIVELKKQDKSVIESILAYGDRLLVGLNTGDLRIYRVNEAERASGSQHGRSTADGSEEAPASPSKKRPVELLREIEKFSRKPIQQLAIIKEANVLVSLSDGYVAFHDLQTFELSERFDQTKGAITFAVISNVIRDASTDINSIVSRLAVVVKRKVLLWTWQDMELVDSPSELTLGASIKSLAWLTATKIIVGTDPGYELVDVDNQNMKDIVKPAPSNENGTAPPVRFGAVNSTGMSYMGMGSWVPKPMAASLAKGQMLLARDVNTLFIDEAGNALEKGQVPWSHAPEAVGYSYPYLLSLHTQSKHALEVRNPETLSLLQSIPLSGTSLLHVPQPNISLAHAGKGFLVGSDRCIWRMNAIGYDSQIEDLLAHQEYDEALAFVGLLEDTLLLDKEERLRQVRIQKAKHIFDQAKYQVALDLFSDAEAPPHEVIALYPEEIAGPLFRREDRMEKDGPSQDTTVSPNPSPAKPSTPKKARPASKDANAVTPRRHQQRDSDVASVKTTTSETAKVVDGSVHRLSGKELQTAVQALFGFLAQTRVQLQKYINFDGSLKAYEAAPGSSKPPFAHLLEPKQETEENNLGKRLLDTAILVDTTLFRAYMFARPRLAGSLFRLDHFCDPKVVEEKLYENSRYLDLIEFLGGKRLDREALELLEKLAHDDSRDDIDDTLKGPRRTVEYLQQLPFEQIELILRFAKWPLETEPDLAMQVFLADNANAEMLPRETVYDFLKSVDPELSLRYLEHVTLEWGDTSSRFHESVVDAYVRKLKESPQASTEENQDALQEKLENFIEFSEYFDCSKVLTEMPDTDARFFESRARLYNKLSKHLEALEIYVFQVQSPAKAEAYCNATHLKTTADGPRTARDSGVSIYGKLLSLYLVPPKPHKANHEAALDLLSRHGSRIPALSLLEVLPSDVSVEKLESYFRGRMRAANTVAREAAVVRALSEVEKSRAEFSLRLGAGQPEQQEKGRNRRVVIREEMLCSACNKRFGRAAVRVWRSGEIRHYGCGEPRSIGASQGAKTPRALADL